MISVPGLVVLDGITVLEHQGIILLFKFDFEGSSPLYSVFFFLMAMLYVKITSIVYDVTPTLVSGLELLFGFRI